MIPLSVQLYSLRKESTTDFSAVRDSYPYNTEQHLGLGGLGRRPSL